jgi:glycosyltransferase involved in cell wall biosynthesis
MSEAPRILHVGARHPELSEGDAPRAAHDLFLASRVAGLDAAFLAACGPEEASALFKPGAIVTGFDARPHEHLLLADAVDDTWHRNLSHRALTWFATFLQEMRPDVVHVHDVATIGLDALLVARRTLPAARLVMTLHDFRAICRASGLMVRRSDGTLCERASALRCHQCFPGTAPEMFRLREDWVKHALSMVDAFVAPTDFVRRRYLAWGLPLEKLHVVPHAPPACAASLDRVVIPGARGSEPASRFGVFGAPLDAASLSLVLDAYASSASPPIAVEVTGAGPRHVAHDLHSRFEAAASAMRDRVRLCDAGACADWELPARMARVDWVVLPSVRWEAFGRLASLAFQAGRPPVCGNIGGLAERVRHGCDGLLFEAGDPASLAATLNRCATEQGLWARLASASPSLSVAEDIDKAYRSVYSV